MPDESLTPERLGRMQEAFERALEVEGPERERYLATLDTALQAQVRGLVEAHEHGRTLESPVSADVMQLLDPDWDRWIGTRVGAWEIIRLVGAGGMGTVYEAARADEQYRTRAAVKLLNQHAASESTIERFRRERQILATLRHPNIASLLDGGVTSDGQPWFTMEFIEGEPITRWCDSRSANVRQRLELFRQVCAAAQYAHQSLVVHRDLKPGNILVATDGTVKLLDFGIAKLMPSEADDDPEAPLTRAGVRALTPDYASPEQLMGEPVGTRSDVYALGIVLYELLAGRRPLQLRGLSAAEVERTVRDVAPTRPSVAISEERAPALGERSAERLKRQVAGDLDAIIMMALRKEPERRYASVADLSADIGLHLEGRPVLARAEGFGYRLGKLIRRRRAESVAAVVASIAVIAGMIGVTVQGRAAERQRARATEVTDFLTTMLGAANPGAFGRDVMMREVLDSAAVRAGNLVDRPELAAEIRQIIGDTYIALGENELAETQFQSAVEALVRVEPQGGRQTATALSRVSSALEFQGKYAAADTVLQAATSMFDRFGYDDETAHSDHYDSRGRIRIRLGDMAGAREFFERAVTIQERLVPRNDSSVANLYGNLGMVTSELGRQQEAESLLLKGIDAAKRAHGEVHPLVAALLSPLATVQERAGLNERSDTTFLAAIEMRKKLLGEEHPDYAWTMFNFADHLMVTKRYDQAIVWSRKVLALRGKSLQDEHPAISTAMSILGRSLDQVDSLSAGEYWLKESLAVRRRVFPAGHWLISSAESILGEHYAIAREFDQAERLLLTSEKALVAARGESAPVVADARGRIVRLYEAWQRPDEAARWRAKLSAEPAKP